jgi:formyl-CoA transferase
MREKSLLENLTVLSLEQATVLPYLTYRLAQDGAQVIRIEEPVRGDPNRYIGDNRLGEERMNTYFLAINAGKKAITLNLAHPKGREILYELVRRLNVDVFCTNQLPKNYAKLGIDYESLRSVKPDIIWFGVTGFGPDSNEAAYDPVLQARSGLMDLTGDPSGPPMLTGVPFGDMGASEHGYGLIMKALYKRAVTGEGSRIDLSMFESTVSWLTVPITLTCTFGYTIRRHGNTHEFFAPVSVFETKDGHVYLAVGNDRQWESLVSLPPFSCLAKPEYARNAGRIADVAKLNQAINEITRTFTTAELVALLQQAQVPVAPVKTVAQVVEDPLVKSKLLRSYDKKTGGKLILAPPPYTTPYLEENQRTLSFPPRFGEHNEEIYGGVLGFDHETLEALRKEQII